jgi:hypothetical protein
MNAADLARLDLAKRAYRATEPTATEVQRGVRRARLGLRRPKERRRWFSKGLVMVVLAVGGLAYAKPQAMGELVSNLLQASSPRDKPPARGGSALAFVPPERPHHAAATVVQPLAVAAPNDKLAAASDGALAPPLAEKLEALRAKPAPRAAAVTSASAAPASMPRAASTPAASEGSLADAASVSDWGRVGQALARGDEGKALAALSELSESADQRTRDKADLGRAQLLMANGNRDSACAIARSLTNRRAGSRIERQAQALLKSCTR